VNLKRKTVELWISAEVSAVLAFQLKVQPHRRSERRSIMQGQGGTNSLLQQSNRIFRRILAR
jgi:hypothetical protein